MYICPDTKSTLVDKKGILISESGRIYKPIKAHPKPIYNFLDDASIAESKKFNDELYSQDDSLERYKNFLNWLFATFKIDEFQFRHQNALRLQVSNGDKVLITGCGMGDDIAAIQAIIGSKGTICAQDYSSNMVMEAQKLNPSENVYFSISDAENLPYESNYFSAAFHFGGINLFSNPKKAVHEMARVVKDGGRVVFGDEGLAPWLRDTEYGKVVVNNNSLWGANIPLEILPENISNVRVEWVLGDCFYMISFDVNNLPKKIDMDVLHIGKRGGTMRKRYFGALEGVSLELKNYVEQAAQKKGLSYSSFLESIINNHKNNE